jgi:hypothetical protein
MKKQIKEYEIIESKAYIVHATSEEEALDKFGNYQHVSEGDYWPTVRELGKVPDEAVDVVTYF